ncbi:MAG: hypothetical protein OXO49_04010 [Gammaproteobacteria bacterium]|nr:hypothetical protein [Gammaproteobacteria bacterium]MDE0252150.1 hypothetical protein [Gammaproteobacteria bacterium]MDE0402741.1 hypothetical protein [Gammaproteobacteria bacterium]MDE0645544.1 hypothetical protein [Gammaproteobacteria bacterium]
MSFASFRQRTFAEINLLRRAAVATAGRFFWLIPIVVPIIWLAANEFLLTIRLFLETVGVREIQNRLLGLPLVVIAIFLGLRIVAGEINARTLEIVYTVPGGASRVWTTKLLAAAAILLSTEVIMAVYLWFRFGPFPIEAIYGAFQCAIFFLVISMGFSALFRSEVSGAIVSCALLFLFGVFSGFGYTQHIWSPFFNPYADSFLSDTSVLVNILRNRIGFAIVIGILVWLAFLRGERREKLLGG